MSVVEPRAAVEERAGGAQQDWNAEEQGVREVIRGISKSRGGLSTFMSSDSSLSPPPRHIDIETAMLDRLARSWIDVQQLRKSLVQRELDESIVDAFAAAEAKLSAKLTRTLRAHPLWPWLSQFPGLGGAHTALVIGRIGDPRRYPGQRCSEGHYLPPLYAVGSACPIAVVAPESDIATGDGSEFVGTDGDGFGSERRGVCPGVMLAPRTTTGARSLWHWAGLHVDEDGRAPRKRKGQRCTWEPRVRASVMQPGGIAEQIVRLSVPHYSGIYRAEKERLMLRVAETSTENGGVDGDASLRAAERQSATEIAPGRPLRRFEADRIARKIAAKAFLADLLTIWKELA